MATSKRGWFYKLKFSSNQKQRWSSFLSKYSKALSEGKQIITAMDDNINTLDNADFTNRQYIKYMKDNLYDFTNDTI